MAQRRAPPHNIQLPSSQSPRDPSAYLTPTLPSPRLGISPSGRHPDGTLRSPSYFGSLSSSRYDARSLHEQSLAASGGRTRRMRGTTGTGAESNWDTLHEMIGDDEEGPVDEGGGARQGAGLGLGLGLGMSVPADHAQEGIVRRLASHSTLRSFFSARSARTAESPRTAYASMPRHQAMQVPAGQGPATITGVLSTSPPPLQPGTWEETLDVRYGRSQGGPQPTERSRSVSPVPTLFKTRSASSATLRPDGRTGDGTPLLSAVEEERPSQQPIEPRSKWPYPLLMIQLTRRTMAVTSSHRHHQMRRRLPHRLPVHLCSRARAHAFHAFRARRTWPHSPATGVLGASRRYHCRLLSSRQVGRQHAPSGQIRLYSGRHGGGGVYTGHAYTAAV